MQKYVDSIISSLDGRPIAGALVQVNVAGGSAATIYSDNGITPLSNPISTEADGSFYFYAANGRYDLVISKPGFTFDNDDTSDILLFDGTPDVNPIINGNMEIWQDGTSFAAVATDTYAADQWVWKQSGSGAVTITRSTSVPTVAEAGVLFNYSLDIDVTTADGSLAAGDYYSISTRLEGFNWRHFAQRALILSFWVYATKTGEHSVSFSNSGSDRSYIGTYAVSATNTWEYKTVTVSASPSAGTWDYTNGLGLAIRFNVGAGSTFHSTAGTWQTGNYLTTATSVNDMDSTSNYFRMTGVKLELGSVATPLQPEDIGETYRRCQRYKCQTYSYGTAAGASPATAGAVAMNSNGSLSGSAKATWDFPVEMRSAPTLTLYSPQTGASGNCYRVLGAADVAAASTYVGTRSATLYNDGAVTDTETIIFHAVASARL